MNPLVVKQAIRKRKRFSASSAVSMPPGRPKDETKHKDIVSAAADLFTKQGYELTSMEAVARRAGVSKLTIYSHFANKAELFKAMMIMRCDKLMPPDRFISMAHDPMEATLIDIGQRMMTMVYSPESLRIQRIIYGEALHHPEVVKIFYQAGPRRVRDAFGELLSEWNLMGRTHIPDVAKATEQFFSLLKGERLTKVMMLLEAKPSPEEIQQHVRATVTFFLSAYQTAIKSNGAKAITGAL